jgi:4-hydroxy-tetrahydrodipicolinate synthase
MASPATLELRKLRLMVAVKTPYSEDGNIDLAAFDTHVEHLIQNGVEALIIGGTTGEGHLFSWEEHLVLIAHAKTQFKGRVAIVGNTGSNATAEAVNATKKGFACGMDCSLLINPYYGKTSTQGIVMHIEAAMKFGPAIIYNVPGRTGQDIKPETMQQLAGHENFVGVKECMGPERIKQLTDMGMACWSGNDDSCHQERHDCGAMGVISVTANVVPGLFSKMMKERDDATNAKLAALYTWLFTEPNPIGVNTMLMMLDMAKPVFRLPYTFRNLEARQAGVEIINAVGVENFPTGPKGLQVLADSDFLYTISGD